MSLASIQRANFRRVLSVTGVECRVGEVSFMASVPPQEASYDFGLDGAEIAARLNISCLAEEPVEQGDIVEIDGDYYTVQTVQRRPGGVIKRLYAERIDSPESLES